jgi:hypothetical protein
MNKKLCIFALFSFCNLYTQAMWWEKFKTPEENSALKKAAKQAEECRTHFGSWFKKLLSCSKCNSSSARPQQKYTVVPTTKQNFTDKK